MCLAASYADLIVARAAINGSIIFRQEWDLRLHAALGTDHCVHLARSTFGATARASFRTPTRTATGATARLIHQTFLLVELLFAGSENEIISTVAAFEGLVNETQTRDLLVI